ncbi:plasma-membrane choline transporter [Toxoplasma gondii RUB]|uniref:Plasma-membrane choline transporter n=1 Tax=Toxoplasma gondii RUB TaxID=935652 RepID=A0A086M2G1_TOXGO|nr:plasma-membrane choline transporter [Toxoplasma gondii RUB]
MSFSSYAADASLGRDRGRAEGPGAQGFKERSSLSPSGAGDRRLSGSSEGERASDRVDDGRSSPAPAVPAADCSSSLQPSIYWNTASLSSRPSGRLPYSAVSSSTADAHAAFSGVSSSSMSSSQWLPGEAGENPFSAAGNTQEWSRVTDVGHSPRLPRDVDLLGASVHTLAASTCYDGASSALFYPNIRLSSGPAQGSNPFAAPVGTEGDRSRWRDRDQAFGVAPRVDALRGYTGNMSRPRVLGETAYDPHAYFAQDETTEIHSPAESESRGSYQPPCLSAFTASASSAPLRMSEGVSLSRGTAAYASSVSSRSRLASTPARESAPGGLFPQQETPSESSMRHTSTSDSTQRLRRLASASEEFPDWCVSWEHPFLKRSPLDVSRGPLPRRRCTDLFFFVLLLCCWTACAAALLLRLAPSASPLARLSAGIDWTGRVCGYDPGVEDFPLVYWPAKKQPETPIDQELSACSILPVCTKRCPVSFSSEREKGVCPPDTEAAGLCTWYSAGPAALLLRRYCLFVDADGKAQDHGLLSSWVRWVADVDLAWPLVLAAPAAALLLGYFFLWLLQKAAHAVVAGLVLLLEVLLLGAAYEFYCAYAASRALFLSSSFSPNTHPFDLSSPIDTAFVPLSSPAALPASSLPSSLPSSLSSSLPVSLPSSLSSLSSLSSSESLSKSAFVGLPLAIGSGAGNLFLMCLCCLAALLVAFFALFFRRELHVSTSVLTASATLLQQAPSKFLLLVPLAAATALASQGALVVAAVSHLAALGPIPTLPISACIPSLSPWVRLPLLSSSSVALLLALLFVALWTGAFLNAISRMIVSYFASAWYFMPRHMHGRRECLKAKAAEAVKVVFSYHLGSAALGGLILSSVQMLKLLFGWARYRAVRRNHSVFKRILCRVSNCVACLYTPVKFVTPTAFIFVALLGQPFLQASWTAIATLTRNPAATAFVWQIGWLLQLVGQLSISICVAWCTYTLLPMFPNTYSQLSSLWAPVFVAFVLSLYVASICMHVFGLAADTLLQAFLADREMSLQDGKYTAEHAPAALRTLDRYMLRTRPQGRLRRV